MLLSGTNCGYGGTGPHGSVKILKMIVESSSLLNELKNALLAKEKDIYAYGRVLIEFPLGVEW